MLTDIRAFLDSLLDEENSGTVELVNDRGESALFDQVCVLPEGDTRYYAILQPVSESGEEMGDPVVFVFENADGNDVTIDVVTDQYIIHDVFAEYKRIRGAYDDEPDGLDEYEGDELEMLNELEDEEPDGSEDV